MHELPLHGEALAFVDNHAPPAVVHAGRLLVALGASAARDTDTPRLDQLTPVAAGTSAERDWEESGIAELTGRSHGPALIPRGRPATVARGAAIALQSLTAGVVRVDGARLLAQRIGHLSLSRRGDQSANGSARLIRAADGWFALNLPRPEDIDLVPALLQSTVSDHWHAITEWAIDRPVAYIEARAITLGLAVGVCRSPHSGRPWRISRIGGGSAIGAASKPTRVVNLGSLWAAPLAAHLLVRAGAQVTDVESPNRPDGSRLGTPVLYHQLHQGNQLRIVDLPSAAGRRELRALLTDADVVITGSRRLALRRLGASPEQVESSRPRVWVSITGHEQQDRIGFGDDAAAAGGLIARDEIGPVFVGDAIADPLAGLFAAVAATACLRAGGSWRVEVNLAHAAGYAACGPSEVFGHVGADGSRGIPSTGVITNS